MGLSNEWCDRLSSKHSDVRQVLQVARVVYLSLSDGVFKTGDLVLSIDGEACCTFRDVELLIYQKQHVDIHVVRNGKEQVLRVATTQLGSDNTTRLVQWAGMLLESTYPAITISTGFVPKEVRHGTGVYCSRWNYGSPSHMYGLRASTWIVSVNGIATPDLETFLTVIGDLERTAVEGKEGEGCEEAFVRIETVGLTGIKKICTLIPDSVYFKSSNLQRDSQGTWSLK